MNPQLPFRHDGTLASLELPPIHGSAGEPLKPSAALLDVYAGDTLITAAGAGLVLTSGAVAYAWTASEEIALAALSPVLHLRADWTLTVGADTYLRRQYVDVVDVEIITGVTDSVLASRNPNLNEHRRRISGIATGAGSSSTVLVDTARLLRYEPNSLVGSRVRFTAGSFVGDERVITEYDPVAGSLTLADALSGSIVQNIDCYELEFSWEPQIRAAWETIYTTITKRLGRHDAVRLADGRDFREAHIFKATANALELIASGDERDPSYLYSKQLTAKYNEAMAETFIAITQPADATDSTSIEGAGLTTRLPIRIWGK